MTSNGRAGMRSQTQARPQPRIRLPIVPSIQLAQQRPSSCAPGLAPNLSTTLFHVKSTGRFLIPDEVRNLVFCRDSPRQCPDGSPFTQVVDETRSFIGSIGSAYSMSGWHFS